MRYLSRKRRAFTLVELLVVIAIIGVLIALLLPAVQSAREAGRRITCTNNLKQIGLALHIYHDVNLKFPPGFRGEETADILDEKAWGWSALILPFMDQLPLYEKLDLENLSATAAETSGLVDEELTTTLPQFLCPSSAIPELNDWFGYGALGPTASSNYIAVNATDKECDTNNLYDSGRGVFRLNVGVPIGQITDGASNTIGVGERTYGGPDDDFMGGALFSVESVDEEGAVGSVLYPINTLFADSGVDSLADGDWFSSDHPGGAQFMLMDGSVRFIEENIDMPTYRSLGTYSKGDVVGSY